MRSLRVVGVLVVCSLASACVRGHGPVRSEAFAQHLDLELSPEPSAGEEADLALPEDVQVAVVSDPPGLSLLAAAVLEGGEGVERRLCRAPCETYVGRGRYRLTVETRRGRDRAVPGERTIATDGTLELRIESRLARRVGWWMATAALMASGLVLALVPIGDDSDDPECIDCGGFSTGRQLQVAAGAIVFSFGMLGGRVALTTRDVGQVRFVPSYAR